MEPCQFDVFVSTSLVLNFLANNTVIKAIKAPRPPIFFFLDRSSR